MSTTALQARLAALLAGQQPPPAPSDPLVLTSQLIAALAGVSAQPAPILYLAADPTAAVIAAGQSRLVKNTTTGSFARWANDGGTLINLDAPKTY